MNKLQIINKLMKNNKNSEVLLRISAESFKLRSQHMCGFRPL